MTEVKIYPAFTLQKIKELIRSKSVEAEREQTVLVQHSVTLQPSIIRSTNTGAEAKEPSIQ